MFFHLSRDGSEDELRGAGETGRKKKGRKK